MILCWKLKILFSSQFTPDEMLDLFEEEHASPKDVIHGIAERARTPNIDHRSEKYSGNR